jgi:hypothetical protein
MQDGGAPEEGRWCRDLDGSLQSSATTLVDEILDHSTSGAVLTGTTNRTLQPRFWHEESISFSCLESTPELSPSAA